LSKDYQEVGRVFKGGRVLEHDLVHRIKELQERGGMFLVVAVAKRAVFESVTKRTPVLVDQGEESIDCPIIGVQQQLQQQDSTISVSTTIKRKCNCSDIPV
jgi:hypothetical protein